MVYTVVQDRSAGAAVCYRLVDGRGQVVPVVAGFLEHLANGDLDRKLVDAYDRLVTGRSATTDGTVTVSNICTEAGVSRASYYRSPVAALVKELLASGQAPRSKIDTLRAQLRELKAADKDLRRRHADEIRDLKATVATYANQIQILALRNADLEADNQRLRARADRPDAGVIHLADRA